MKETSKRFKNYRIYANITQQELSELTGVSLATIKKFENGSDIKLSTFEKLCNGVGMQQTVDDLIPDIVNRPSVKAQKKIKQRARKVKTVTNWKWGDEE